MIKWFEKAKMQLKVENNYIKYLQMNQMSVLNNQ